MNDIELKNAIREEFPNGTIFDGPLFIITQESPDYGHVSALRTFDWSHIKGPNQLLEIDFSFALLSEFGVEVFLPKLLISVMETPDYFKSCNFLLDFILHLGSRNDSSLSRKLTKYSRLTSQQLYLLTLWFDWLETTILVTDRCVLLSELKLIRQNISLLQNSI